MKFVGTNLCWPQAPPQTAGRRLTFGPTMINRLKVEVVAGRLSFQDTPCELSPPEKSGHDGAGSKVSRLGGWSRFGHTSVRVADQLKTQPVEVAMGCSISTAPGQGRSMASDLKLWCTGRPAPPAETSAHDGPNLDHLPNMDQI